MFHCICNPPASYHIYTNSSALNLGEKKEQKKAFFTAPGPKTVYLAVPGWFGLVFSLATWTQWPNAMYVMLWKEHSTFLQEKFSKGREQFIKSFSTKAQQCHQTHSVMQEICIKEE